MSLADTLRATAAALRAEAARLDALATESETPGAAIITAENSAAEFPGLTSRAFSDAGRRGDFPCFRSGRKLAARREDVTRWLESRRVQPRTRKPTIDVVSAYFAEVAR
jgi:cobalamin biosynthesis protein CbiG